MLVFDDLVGLTAGKPAKFVKRYAALREEMARAVEAYAKDVRAKQFPTASNAYAVDGAELDALRAELSARA